MTRNVIFLSGLRVALIAIALVVSGLTVAQAEAITRHHGLSLFGGLKYPPDFTHFDYVNPDAPKGGSMRLAASGTFDSLNNFTIKGQVSPYVGLVYDTLAKSSHDEPASQYGLLAEDVAYPEDFSRAVYRLRPEARWHDGMPVSPEDVIFSFETLVRQNPLYNRYYADVERVEKTGLREVTFFFSQTGNRELPQIVGQFPVAPMHYWTGVDAAGKPRDIAKTTLEPPLGSGPYRIAEIEAGSRLTLERVDDYWGQNLPVNRGYHNFDTLSVLYFRDSTLAFEGFKADAYDVRIETTARNWVEGYDFPAVHKGWVKRQGFTLKQARPMSGFVFNLRRDKFTDRKIRRAFNFAFDFNWTNRNIFHGLYKRTRSFFQNSELASTPGEPPRGVVRELLEAQAAHLPPETLDAAFVNPTSPDRNAVRENLRTAHRLFAEAGWGIRDGVMTHLENGDRMRVEFLLSSSDGSTYERILLPYKQRLKRLGVIFDIRVVDPSQYQNRVQNFDFDMILAGWGQSLSPGNEQRDYWSIVAADRPGSRNYMGLKNPAIDALIDDVIFAPDRAALVAACKALDRALQWEQFIVPLWYNDTINVAWWDRFGYHEPPPDYNLVMSQTWWYAPAFGRDDESR